MNTSQIFVSLLICKLLWDQEDKKRPDERCCAKILSFNKQAVPIMLSEIRAKCAEKKQVGGVSY